MDYPLLNLVFGLGLILTLVVSVGLRILLSKVRLPFWLSLLSWLALIVSVLAALYIEVLFLRLMTRTFNLQIGLGLLIIAGIGALLTASLYRSVLSQRLASILFSLQILASLVSLVITFILYRSLVPIPPGVH